MQLIEFFRFLLQESSVFTQLFAFVDGHAPFDAAQQRITFVIAKIRAGLVKQHPQDFLNLVFAGFGLASKQKGNIRLCQHIVDLLGNIFGGKCEIDMPRANSRMRHTVETGGGFQLRKGNATFGLDGADAVRAVSTRTGEDDAHCMPAVVFGE